MIVSSEIILNNPQVDGRIIVTERHIDDQGVEYLIDYMANAGTNINANLVARADELNQQFIFDEQNAPVIAQQKIDEIKVQIASLQDSLEQAEISLTMKSGD